MTIKPKPEQVRPILEPAILRKPDLMEAGAVPILDQAGHELLDQDGRVIHELR